MQKGEHDLLEPAGVADDHRWHVRRGLKGKVESLGAGDVRDEADAGLDAGSHIERMQGKLELTALDD